MKICIIGGGNMGGAIATGLAQSSKLKGEDITIIDRVKAKEYGHGIVFKQGDYEAISSANIVILAVKPWVVESVIKDNLHLFKNESQIIISVAAKITLQQLQSYFGTAKTIFKIIPNTAIEIKMSMSFICFENANEQQKTIVSDLFNELGTVEFIDEKLFDAATSVASCGIAYAFKYIRATMQAGVEMGLTAEQSKNASIQALIGAASLLRANNSHPEVEIDKVTTPGGMTIKGINELDNLGFSKAIINALKASCN